MTAISVWAINEGGMMLYYILFAGLLFAPFAIVSIFSLLDLKKHRKTIQGGIWLGTFLLLAPSYALPFFYEWGGIAIALVCTLIGALVWLKRNEIEWQISIFNLIGTAMLTVILISLFLAVTT